MWDLSLKDAGGIPSKTMKGRLDKHAGRHNRGFRGDERGEIQQTNKQAN